MKRDYNLIVEEELFNPPEVYLHTPLLIRIREGGSEYYLEKHENKFNLYFCWQYTDCEDNSCITEYRHGADTHCDIHKDEELIESFDTCEQLLKYCANPATKTHTQIDDFLKFCKEILYYKNDLEKL